MTGRLDIVELRLITQRIKRQIERLDGHSDGSDADNSPSSRKKGKGGDKEQAPTSPAAKLAAKYKTRTRTGRFLSDPVEDEPTSEASSSDSNFLEFQDSELQGWDESFNPKQAHAHVKNLLAHMRVDERYETASAINDWFQKAAADCKIMELDLDDKEESCDYEGRGVDKAHRLVTALLEQRGGKTIDQMRKFHARIQDLRSLIPESRLYGDTGSGSDDEDDLGIDAGGGEAGGPAGAAGTATRRSQANRKGLRGKLAKVIPFGPMQALMMAAKRREKMQKKLQEELAEDKQNARRKKGRPTVSSKFLASDLLEVISQQQEEIAHLRTKAEMETKKLESLKAVLEYVRTLHVLDEVGGAIKLMTHASGRRGEPVANVALGLPELNEASRELFEEMRENARVKYISELLTTKEGREFLAQCAAEHNNQFLEAQTKTAEAQEEAQRLQHEIQLLEQELSKIPTPASRVEVLRTELNMARRRIERARVRSNKYMLGGADAGEGGGSSDEDAASAGAKPGQSPKAEEAKKASKATAAWVAEAPESVIEELERIYAETSKVVREVETQKENFLSSLRAAKRRAVDEVRRRAEGIVDFDTADDMQDPETENLRSIVKEGQKNLTELRTEQQKLEYDEGELKAALKRYREQRRRDQEAASALAKRRGAEASKKETAAAQAEMRKAMQGPTRSARAQAAAASEAEAKEEVVEDTAEVATVRAELQSTKKEVEVLEQRIAEMQGKLGLEDLGTSLVGPSSPEGAAAGTAGRTAAGGSPQGAAGPGGAPGLQRQVTEVIAATSVSILPQGQQPIGVPASAVSIVAGVAAGACLVPAAGVTVLDAASTPAAARRAPITSPTAAGLGPAVQVQGTLVSVSPTHAPPAGSVPAGAGRGAQHTAPPPAALHAPPPPPPAAQPSPAPTPAAPLTGRAARAAAREAAAAAAAAGAPAAGDKLGAGQAPADAPPGPAPDGAAATPGATPGAAAAGASPGRRASQAVLVGTLIQDGEEGGAVLGTVVSHVNLGIEDKKVTDSKQEDQINELLALDSESTLLLQQISQIEERIRIAKLKGAVPSGAAPEKAAEAAKAAAANQPDAPEENKAMRREVNRKQNQLNALRKRWWTEKGKQGLDGTGPGQSEAAARMLLSHPPDLSQEALDKIREADLDDLIDTFGEDVPPPLVGQLWPPKGDGAQTASAGSPVAEQPRQARISGEIAASAVAALRGSLEGKLPADQYEQVLRRTQQSGGLRVVAGALPLGRPPSTGGGTAESWRQSLEPKVTALTGVPTKRRLSIGAITTQMPPEVMTQEMPPEVPIAAATSKPAQPGAGVAGAAPADALRQIPAGWQARR